MKALALTVALAVCAGHAEAAIGPKASRTIVVHGKEFDLDAPLPMDPRTLPDGHPLLRETALADDSQEFAGRLAPGFHYKVGQR